MDYQKGGTAHFCQTFAALIFMGDDKKILKARNYRFNIEQAVTFWINLFNSDKAIAEFFLKNIQTSTYAEKGVYFEGTNNPLKNATFVQLQHFLNEVCDNAQTFVSCSQG